MEKHAKIFIAGHRGLVGSAILRRLQAEGFDHLILRTSSELNLLDQKATLDFFMTERPEYVFFAAAKVGGIMANSTYPAEFIYNNLMLGCNVIDAAWKSGVKKLLNLGSSCIYPRMAPQPMKEEELLSGLLEPTNEGYAISKIAAIKLCKYYNQQYGTNFISCMPTNEYGIGDNFNMETAHLLPMVLRRFHLCKLLMQGDFKAIRRDLKRYKLGWNLDRDWEKCSDSDLENVLGKIGAFRDRIVLWGDGSVFREMMASDDLADACLYLMLHRDAPEIGDFVNITNGQDIRLKDLFELIRKIVAYTGTIEYDTSKPNGMPRKCMDATKIKSLGWQPSISLEEGISRFYAWYRSLE